MNYALPPTKYEFRLKLLKVRFCYGCRTLKSKDEFYSYLRKRIVYKGTTYPKTCVAIKEKYRRHNALCHECELIIKREKRKKKKR